MRQASTRMLQLDLLRGIAILLVLFAHFGVPHAAAGSWAPVLGYLNHLGPTGVDLFFVLSGFLVGGLLFKEILATGRLDVRRFLIRRGFKIWPSYFLFIAVVFAGLVLRNHVSAGDAFRALLPNLLHVQNYFGSPRELTWSLAVEEHFYLALPFLLILLIRRAPPRVAAIPAVPVIAVGLLVLCALLRLRDYAGDPPYNPHFATHLRLDSLFFGVLLAYLFHFAPGRLAFASRHPVLLLSLSAALLLPFPALVTHDSTDLLSGVLGFAILYVGYGALLLAVVHAPLGSGWLGRRLNGWAARVVAAIGFFSYPIYLWHLDAMRLMPGLLGSRAAELVPPGLRWVAAFAVYVGIAGVTGVFFGLLLEKPSLALRDRWFPPRVRSSVAPP